MNKLLIWGKAALLVGAGWLAGCQNKEQAEGYTEVRGRALDAATGQPVPHALVQLLETHDGGGGNILFGGGSCGLHFDSTRADASGQFVFKFEARWDCDYSLRATRNDYLHLDGAFDFCLPEKMPQVRKARRNTADVPLVPTGFVRVRAIDDPAVNRYYGGIVSTDVFILGNHHVVDAQLFAFGKSRYGVSQAADTSAVLMYICQPTPRYWWPTDSTGATITPGMPLPVSMVAHDTVECVIRY